MAKKHLDNDRTSVIYFPVKKKTNVMHSIKKLVSLVCLDKRKKETFFFRTRKKGTSAHTNRTNKKPKDKVKTSL